jgi:CRP/FNR family cyclic AMP-dependent transcriptional regulator
MPKAAKSQFDPKLFLAKVGEGKSISRFKKTATEECNRGASE